MFKSKKDALAAIKEHFPEQYLAVLTDALEPRIGFVPLAGANPLLGQTRIGGTPDLPKGMDWPLRPSPENAGEIADRGGSNHRDHILKHLSLDYPFEFFAQIDLAEADALAEIARELPTEGRLLFFYDSMSGPWNDVNAISKVIWDRSASDELERKSIPEVLQRLAREYNDPVDLEEARKQMEETLAGVKHLETEDPETYAAIRDSLAQTSESGEDREQFKPPYWGDARAMQLFTGWSLPDRFSLEAQNNAALRALFEETFVEDDDEFEFSDIYDEFLQETFEQDFGYRPSQLLGSPSAEQDDPRYDAVVADRFGKPFLSSEEWQANRDKIMAGAADWRLLLQIDLADYLQDKMTEGTVYFLIKKDDLAARRFDDVLAIYQQT